jgi:hypothetical protein
MACFSTGAGPREARSQYFDSLATERGSGPAGADDPSAREPLVRLGHNLTIATATIQHHGVVVLANCASVVARPP